jgi:paraquat-inducible protein B
MSDRHPTAVVRSKIEHKRRLSLIWAVPVVTVIIGAWLAWSTISERGPLITITFETAEGLQAGQSHVRHKDVDMGVVRKISLTPDLKRVLVTVRMNSEAESLLTDKAEFWVVRPRFFAGSISGLQTLFSGSYIDLLPSAEGGQPARNFVGLENPPVLQSDMPGRTFLLRAKSIGSLNLGSPVLYRDLEVGEILGWDVGEMARNIVVHIFVRAPFDKYVHDNSRFWNASGAKVELGPNGIQFQVESLRAVILGGIAFDTPENPKFAEETQADHSFPLYGDADAAEASSYKRALPFVAYFNTSVSGLGAGSPVTLRGQKVGEVSSVGLVYDRAQDAVVVPVHFTMEPERIALLDLPMNADARIRELVRRGLRVKLGSANILTGQMRLEINVYKDAGPGELTKQDGAYVIPVLGGSSEDITVAATDLVNRLNSIPFEAIGRNLDQTLAAVNALVNDKQLSEAVTELRTTLASTQALVDNLNHGLTPVIQRLPAIANGLESSVVRTDKLVASLQNGYGDDSRFSRDINQMMNQLTDAARSIRMLADLLSRHPEALIRGRTDIGGQ